MARTPTPKQVRNHYSRLTKATEQLRRAYWRAKEAGVVEIKTGEVTPGHHLFIFENRINETTEFQLANAMRREIFDELRR